MPRVSVIMPVFNGERFVAKAIESVRKQDFGDVEIIVVDDGSTDRSGEIIRSLDGVCYHFQENRGAGIARNFGVSVARGEWIAFLDADDVCYSNRLSVQMACAANGKDESFIYSDMDVIDEHDRLIERNFLGAKGRRRRKRQNLMDHLFPGLPPPYLSTVLMRRKQFLDSGGFNPSFKWKYMEDCEFFGRIARMCSVEFIPQGLVQYRVDKSRAFEDPRMTSVNWDVLLECLPQMARSEDERRLLVRSFHREYARYLSNHGKRNLRHGDFKTARDLCRLAFLQCPLYFRNWLRWMLAFTPLARNLYVQSKRVRRGAASSTP